ncbi:hypothetical protein ACI76W_04685 [Capnocytophaga canimorsus]
MYKTVHLYTKIVAFLCGLLYKYKYEYPLDTHPNTYARNSHEFLVQFRW